VLQNIVTTAYIKGKMITVCKQHCVTTVH